MSKNLSPEMERALAALRMGRLIRYSGGFWSHVNPTMVRSLSRPEFMHPEPYVGVQTLRALVKRGLAQFVEYRPGRTTPKGQVLMYETACEAVPMSTAATKAGAFIHFYAKHSGLWHVTLQDVPTPWRVCKTEAEALYWLEKANAAWLSGQQECDATIAELRSEVERLRGTTNFETVPKEAYDRLRLVAQLACDALADPHKMSLGASALSKLAEEGITPNQQPAS